MKWAEQGPAGDRDSPDCASVLLSAPGQVPVFVRRLGRRDYSQTWQAMRDGEANLLAPELALLSTLHQLAWGDDLRRPPLPRPPNLPTSTAMPVLFPS